MAPHPEEIKAAIRKRGVTLVNLSRQWGFHPSAAGIAIRRPWPEVRAKIAELLGTSPQLLWPADYDDNGAPKSHRKLTGLRPGSPVQKTSRKVA